MTTMPKLADFAAHYTYTYDAWNRLVKVADGATTVAKYEYDGQHHRTVKKTYVSGTLDETRWPTIQKLVHVVCEYPEP